MQTCDKCTGCTFLHGTWRAYNVTTFRPQLFLCLGEWHMTTAKIHKSKRKVFAVLKVETDLNKLTSKIPIVNTMYMTF